MAEYIDKAKLRELLFTYYSCVTEETNKRDYRGETLMAYEVADMIHDCLDNTPTADVAPVVHGRWVPTQYDGYADGYPVWDEFECSVCGFEHDGEDDTLTSYCPNCGAKMDLEG